MGRLSYTDQEKIKGTVKINHSVDLAYQEKHGDAAGFIVQVVRDRKARNRDEYWAGVKK